MAEGISTDELFAAPSQPAVQPAAPGPVTTEQLFAQQPTQAPAKPLTTDDLFSTEDKAAAAYKQLTAGNVLDKNGGLFPKPEQIRQSPVGVVMDEFNKPMRFTAARVVDALEVVTPGIKAQLNPANEWIPNTGFHDIVNYITPKPEQLQEFLDRNGTYPYPSWVITNAYKAWRFGSGLALDVFGDPLFFMSPKVGQLTEAAEAAYKAGDLAAKERNIISVNYPFSEKQMGALSVAKAEEVASGAVAKAREIPAVDRAVVATANAITAAKESEVGQLAAQTTKVAKDFLESLSPWTRDPEIDLARVEHTVKQAGDRKYVESFIKEHASRNYTDEELKLLRNTIESSPNLQIDGNGLVIQKSRELVEQYVRQHLEAQGVKLPTPRVDQVVDTVMEIKAQNAMDLAERIKAGIINPDNVETVENYLVHKISDEGRRYLNKNPAMAAAFEEAGVIKRTEQSLNGKTVSTYDAGRYTRKMRTTLDDANRIMQEKTKGKVGAFFMEDPILATAMKRSETRKFLRDRELLDILTVRGVPKDQLRKQGMYWVDKDGKEYLPINHPNFERRTFIIKTEGQTFKKSLAELMFPKEIAQKVSYDILPRNAGGMSNVNAFLDSYNRVFRNFALFKPDYYLENWVDNILKNVINGVRLESYSDAARLIVYLTEQQKALSTGDKINRAGAKIASRYFPVKDTIRVNGKDVPFHQMAEMIDRYNIRTGSHFDEGLEKVLFTGKKVTQEHTLASKGKAMASQGANLVGNVFRGMHVVGESGENLTRVSFFVDLLKRGYKPEVAAFEVEKFLFNFKRTTPNMDVARRFYNPFIQAAFKTAEIAPQMMARKAWVMNAYENNLMSALQASFNDPVTSWSVQQIYPEYYKMHDRIAGPLLPANHWLVSIGEYGPRRTQLPLAVALGLPGGMGILNQFAVAFDSQAFKQAESSPVMRSAITLIAGRDPWTGRDIDIVKSAPDFSRRARVAITSFVTGAVALPNAEKYLMQKFGLVNPDYVEPASVLAFHGMFSKFGKVTNLEKEYFMKLGALAAIEKELTNKLRSESAKEFMGKTSDINMANHPVLNSLASASRPYSSAEVYEKMTNGIRDIQVLQYAAANLQGQKPTIQDIAGMLKNVHSTVKELNKNYQVLTETYFKTMNAAQIGQTQGR